MRTAILSLVGVCVACVPLRPSLIRELPDAERDAYDACLPHVRAHSCPDRERWDCMGVIESNFASLPSSDERRRYLVEAGCPDVLVTAAFSGQRRVPPTPSYDAASPNQLRPAGAP
jgi:hypothetical protein